MLGSCFVRSILWVKILQASTPLSSLSRLDTLIFTSTFLQVIWPNQSLSIHFMHLQGTHSSIWALLDPSHPLLSPPFLNLQEEQPIFWYQLIIWYQSQGSSRDKCSLHFIFDFYSNPCCSSCLYCLVVFYVILIVLLFLNCCTVLFWFKLFFRFQIVFRFHWVFCVGCFVFNFNRSKVFVLSLIHIWRCRRIERCRSRWSPYH